MGTEKYLEIFLTDSEMAEGIEIGLRRYNESKARKRRDNDEARKDLCRDIVGGLAERAVAKALGIPWVATIGTFKDPDVGIFQVRGSEHHKRRDGEWRQLIIRESDKDLPDSTIFIFVTMEMTRIEDDPARAAREPSTVHGWVEKRMIVHGYITHGESKKVRKLDSLDRARANSKSWTVKTRDLHSVEGLAIARKVVA